MKINKTLTNINRYLYEIEYKKRFEIPNLPFDELLEKLTKASKKEKELIISKLDEETLEKIENLKEGGII